jgi:hypothetical protein
MREERGILVWHHVPAFLGDAFPPGGQIVCSPGLVKDLGDALNATVV